MTMLPLFMTLERALPFLLFALYLVTAFRICSFPAWQAAGAPNPFVPRQLKPIARDYSRKLRFEAFA